jgi:hypothetical protein
MEQIGGWCWRCRGVLCVPARGSPLLCTLQVAFNRQLTHAQPHTHTKPIHQVVKWAFQASTRETSSFLIEKGRRDARAWVVATGLEPMLAAKIQGQMAGGEPVLIVPGGGGRPAAAHAEQQAQQQGVGDHHLDRKRHRGDEDAIGMGQLDASQPAHEHQRPHHHHHHHAKHAAPAAAGGGEGVAVPGLTGQPRTDTDPLHDKTPSSVSKE